MNTSRVLSLMLLSALLVFRGGRQERQLSRDFSPFIEKYRKSIPETMKANGIADLSISVVVHDSLLWCEGFGYYNASQRKPVTGHTPFFIGSICKIFTGLAVMKLEAEKKLSIDDPYGRYVPAFAMKTRFA